MRKLRHKCPLFECHLCLGGTHKETSVRRFRNAVCYDHQQLRVQHVCKSLPRTVKKPDAQGIQHCSQAPVVPHIHGRRAQQGSCAGPGAHKAPHAGWLAGCYMSVV